jgi:succinate-acetate transporter protein
VEQRGYGPRGQLRAQLHATAFRRQHRLPAQPGFSVHYKHKVIQPRGYADTLGIFFLLFGVFAPFMLTTSLLKRALAVVVAVAVPRFLISGVAELTGIHAVSQAAAVLGFLLTAVALYTAFALLLEDPRGREVLPVGRLGAGPARDP